jgi:hypothetical protein
MVWGGNANLFFLLSIAFFSIVFFTLQYGENMESKNVKQEMQVKS